MFCTGTERKESLPAAANAHPARWEGNAGKDDSLLRIQKTCTHLLYVNRDHYKVCFAARSSGKQMDGLFSLDERNRHRKTHKNAWLSSAKPYNINLKPYTIDLTGAPDNIV